MKRFIQIAVTLVALAVFIWGMFFSQWSFQTQTLSEPDIIKEIANGVCLS